MVRPPLSPEDRARGERLGALLREARGARSMVEVAASAAVPVETLRKIESGRIPTPAFFTIAALAHELRIPLDALAAQCAPVAELDTSTPDRAAAARGPAPYATAAVLVA